MSENSTGQLIAINPESSDPPVIEEEGEEEEKKIEE